MANLRVAIVGDIAVGKTSYLNRLITGEYNRFHNHNPNTMFQLPFATNRGKVTFTVIEGPNHDDVDGLMVMFDCTNRDSFTNSIAMIRSLSVRYPQLPVVWMGNKVDNKERVVMARDIQKVLNTLHYPNLKYYEVSARSNYQIDRPFLHIVQQYYLDPSVKFVEMEAVVPPTVELIVDQNQLHNNIS
jgi:GTP-binding nuclear protein Ran